MWRVLRIVIVIAIVAVAAVWLAENPGRVTLAWHGWRIDTSVAVLVAAVLLLSVAAAVLYRGWVALRRAPGRIGDAWRLRRRQQGYQALTRGMVAVAAGDAEEAQRQVRRADVLLNEPPLTMLLSAQAAQLAGDDRAAAKFFAAMSEREETEFLGVRGLLAQAMNRGADDEARTLARRAWRLRPKSEWVAGVLFDLEVRAGRWQDARATLDDVLRRRLISAERGRRRNAVLATELARDAGAHGGDEEAMRHAREAHDLAPDLVPATVALARGLIAAGKEGRARALIERAWLLNPHPDLAETYLAASAEKEPLGRVRAVQRLVHEAPNVAESRYALSRALVDARLWGEARKVLAGFGDDPPARACRLLAEIEEAEHGNLALSRQWLMRATVADPDPAWVCGACGETTREWYALCGKCRGFDTLSWRVPPHAMTLSGPAHLRSLPSTQQPSVSARAADPADASSSGDSSAANTPAS